MHKTVAVTGGTGGLGGAVVERLSADSYDIKLSAIDRAEADAYRGKGEIEPVSLSDLEQVQAWAERIGSVRGLVCLAGGFAMEPLSGASSEHIDFLIDINLKTVVNCLSAFGNKIVEGGSVVLVGAEVYQGSAGKAIYAATKAAVVSLSRSAALEWQPRGVRVNCILPNTIDTPANRKAMPNADFEKWAKPHELADVISYLFSDAAAVVNGNTIHVGRTLDG